MTTTRNRNAERGSPSRATKPPRPRVKRIDPEGVKFKGWMLEAEQASPKVAVARPTIATPSRRRSAIADSPSYVHAYKNIRPRVDVNTCGQAAISTLLDFFAKDPFQLDRKVSDAEDGKQYWNDGETIDAVKISGFGPDALGGVFGTTPSRLKKALDHFGLNAEVAYSNDTGKTAAWVDLQMFVAQRKPVPVLVDCTHIGGPPLGLHWAIVYRIEDDKVFLGNWRQDPFAANVFLSAWQCPQVPSLIRDYHYCAVYTTG